MSVARDAKAAAKAAASPTASSPPAALATTPGRLVAVAVFTAMLAVTGAVAWPAVGAVLAMLSLLPSQRRAILAVAAVVVPAFAPPMDLELLASLAEERGAAEWVGAWPAVAGMTLAFGFAWTEAVRRRPKSPLGRRPVLALLLLAAALLAVAGDGGLAGAPWFFVAAFALSLSSYLWFFAYSSTDSRLAGASPTREQVGLWRPFWGFSNVPLGKGPAYLGRAEARDDAALAAAQWSGLRLMAWATALTVAMDLLRFALYAPDGPAGGLPPLAVVLDAQARGEAFPFATRWASVWAEFAMTLLHMMTWGHGIVATCRMAGFAVAPNTDRPLESTSVVEFYNRYYFYFKELLATFFFYPTFLRFFRGAPRLRLFAACFAAAGAGNFLFHFLRDGGEVLAQGLLPALVAYRVYACYALVLGVAVGVSQLRLDARKRRRPEGARRYGAMAVVIVFYALLNVLDVRTPHPLPVYAAFYGSLVLP